jgi:hypothetical protein
MIDNQVIPSAITSVSSLSSPSSSFEVDTSLARKRRIARRAKQRSEEDDNEPMVKRARSADEEEDGYDSDATNDSNVSGNNRKPSIRGIKKQARYEPGVPMTKDQLAAWRKEARRVRNRESAAASRRKTRDRINELEALVSNLQSKYVAALHRIIELETNQAIGKPTLVTSTPSLICQDLLDAGAEPRSAHTSKPSTPPPSLITVSPPLSPQVSSSEISLADAEPYPHTMISRPTAVCV